MSKKPADRRTQVTYQTIQTLRVSNKVFEEFISCAQAYSKAAQKLAEQGKIFAEALDKVARLQSGDIGEGIGLLAQTTRMVEVKREHMATSIQNDLIPAIKKSLKPDMDELSSFETDLKKSQANGEKQVKTLEVASKKAGKKGPEALKQSIAQLNDKVKEVDNMKGEKLRNALLLERKKFCNFLTQWQPVLAALIEISNEENKFKEQEGYWRTLAASNNQLPSDLEELMKQKERTLIQIQGTGGYENYDYDYGGGSDYGGGGSFYGGSQGLGTVTALYDYAGEQAEDLPFYAGDVITLIRDDDGSGWLEGELNGMRGIFPTSYVQYN